MHWLPHWVSCLEADLLRLVGDDSGSHVQAFPSREHFDVAESLAFLKFGETFLTLLGRGVGQLILHFRPLGSGEISKLGRVQPRGE